MRLFGALPCLALLAVGCGGPPVAGVEADEVNLSLFAITSDPEVAALTASTTAEGGIYVKRAFIATSSLTLVPCLEDAAKLKLGPSGYDLIAPPLAGETVTTAVTDLCAIELTLAPLGDKAHDDEPDDAAISIKAENEAGDALDFVSDSEQKLVLESVNGTSFGPLPLLLTFDVAKWLDGVSSDPDQVEEGSALVEKQLADAATLYEDTNGNYLLDDDEMTPIATVR
jgi:hypothetical protein